MTPLLRSQPIDKGSRHVVEAVVQNPRSRSRMDKTVVVARCLHLHISADRADACRDRLARVPAHVLAELMQPGAGRQSVARTMKREAA